MSIENEFILAPSPSTARAQPTQLACDSKGERLAYASNKSIFLRSIDNPSISRQYTGHKTPTTVARFSPSGYYVASGDEAGTVRVWDCVGEGTTKGEYFIVSGRINDLAWDGDSQRIIAVGDGREKYGRCITADSGNSCGEVTGHTRRVNAVAIRQQRPIRAATAGDDMHVNFYHGVPFRVNTRASENHVNYVCGLGFSPDGANLVSVGSDRRIWLYDGKTGETKTQIGAGEHTGSILGVSWSPDSRKFVTASADQTVKVWDVEQGKVVQNWKMGGDVAVSVSDQQVGVVWPNGRSDGLIISLSLTGDLNYLVEGNEKLTRIVQSQQKEITAFARYDVGDKQTLWTGGIDGKVYNWDLTQGSAERVDGQGHPNYITGLAATKEGNGHIYSVGWDDTIRAVDASSNTYNGSATKLASQPKNVVTAGDNIVLVAKENGIVIFKDGSKVGDFGPSKSTINGIAANGSSAAIGYADSSVQICSIANNILSPSVEIKVSRDAVTSLAFSPNSSMLAVGDSRGRIVVYRTADGTIVTDRWTSHTARINSLAWNSEGSHLASGSLDTRIFVWSLACPGEWLTVAHAHQEGVNGVVWITDRTKIASVGADAALNHASFILPRTGQRLRGLLNLSSYRENDDQEEREPLLERRAAPQSQTESVWHKCYQKYRSLTHTLHPFITSELGKGVLKCSIAYMIGTLGTFLPAFADFLGQQDGKHMVATVTVYFHPARTKGSMILATIYAFLAFIYAALISVTSMGISVFFEDKLDLLPLGHAIVLLVFCGGGLGFVGWVKLRRADPLVNVACSLTSLAIINVLTKEGAVQQGDLSLVKIVQVLKMVVMGVIATTAVCFLIFPVSARTKLRKDLVEMTASLGTMLAIITESFLQGSAEHLKQDSFQSALNRNKKAYVTVEKWLKEEKVEHYLAGTEREYRLEKKLVRAIQDITQNIGGLQSAANLQFDLLRQSHQTNRNATPMSAGPSSYFTTQLCHSIFSPLPRSAHEETRRVLPGLERLQSDEPTPGHEQDSIGTQAPADIFERFIAHLGPSMRSLSYTVTEILRELPYGPGPEYKVAVNCKFRISLDRALDLYRNARNDALNLVYLQKDSVKTKSVEMEADLEEVAASCGHFSFSLQAFTEQLKEILEILDELHLETEERPNGRSWGWLKFWRPTPPDHTNKWTSATRSATERGETSIAPERYSIPETATSPVDLAELSRKGKVRYKIWRALRVFRRDDVKFAIKVGAGAAIYALPSFMPSTRPFYSYWRGEWGLLSYMLVCSMTIGASNTTGFARFFGTTFGAICAVVAWKVTSGEVFALAFICWVMAFCTAHIILIKDRGPMGRFIMLTYNLTVLYAYSLSRDGIDDGEDEGGRTPPVVDIAIHRVVSVLSGILWGIIITRVIWPISARTKLKGGLSLLWLWMSVIWKREPLTTMVDGNSAIAYFTPREKLEFQRFMVSLETLYNSARSEFELRGPFPEAIYISLLTRTRRMLDAIQAMNLEIMKNLTASEGEAAMLSYTLPERMQLSARISHLLSVVASSMKLEYPLNDALPEIDHARDRLLARLHRFRQDTSASRLTTDEDYALLYAYALVTGQLGNEITAIIGDLSKLFGILDEDVLKLE
ncbi:actin-interacting protein [Paracoccidioides lutzii Pb01]|uniref:Actin-interacting protein n=1 Tax=Paracoccidioides lutzii (strain ATCC MYA-826 / Pb01) TaxID=502779 RepID=C1GR52_PARBA|nr:actin-interacting protein [Paracoccidioides lutzii Pb01]EEH38076.2 actin-interacting protein [Paracoccidioides lutzii Pb01]